jgi:anthranilate phosphoribosyltransferase
MLKSVLNQLLTNQTFTREQSGEIFKSFLEDNADPVLIGACLTLLTKRGITSNELLGFRDSLIELGTKVKLSGEIIDVCGTGGDRKNTFNISTLSAFILGGAGVKVAKHGSIASSSAVGSSDLLIKLGVHLANSQDILQKMLDYTNVCFIHAPYFYPILSKVGNIRRSLGIRTIYNLLGPICNPANPQKQLIGVADPTIVSLYRDVLTQIGISFSLISCLNGYDEISLTGNWNIITVDNIKLFSPEDCGFKLADPLQLKGGDNIADAKKIFIDVISGNGTIIQNQVVIANAASALQLSYPEKSFSECCNLASDSLHSGNAKKCLDKVLEFSKGHL